MSAIGTKTEKPGRSSLERTRKSSWSRLHFTLRTVYVRLRFLLILAVIFVVVGKWDTLWNCWDSWTKIGRSDAIQGQTVSAETEFWCPMCPGVVSDWPAKCPVCNMDLVKRKKHEAVPLPDGVMARMQLTPYRIQLAGVKTSLVTYQLLSQEILTGGFVESNSMSPPQQGTARPESSPSSAAIKAQVFDKDLPYLYEGQAVAINSDAFPGRPPFAGRIQNIRLRQTGALRAVQVLIAVDDAHRELRAGMFVTAQIKVLPRQWNWYTRTIIDDWQNETFLSVLANSLISQVGPSPLATVEVLVDMAAKYALLRQSMVLVIPETAVVDTGKQKMVYVENGPGMFDGVEVMLGPRCGAFYPVLRGLQAGQRVVTAGAFLVDAETRLNPAAASLYFGSGATREESSAANHALPSQEKQGKVDAEIIAARNQLDSEDRRQVEDQEYCPVLGKNRLGAMGKPFKVVINGESFFLCCEGCKEEATSHSERTLVKVAELKRKVKASRSKKSESD
jgi:hypothetical protein